ncbi:CD9 antigen-like [Poecilia reticulata]|uniref:Tetraspanin n=1 Tax=Poecilia reticulata TaxID=8081 RepID=A0A3P9PPZ0_POERE|nr:PREDICTED: CD9 antigen-like [Poecilia reticulata]
MKSSTENSFQIDVLLDRCGVACKYMLIVFNIIFTVLGFASLVFGLWLNFQGNSRDVFNVNDDDKKRSIDSNVFHTVVYILVILGSVMVALGIFGEHSACNDNKIALLVYCVFLFLLAVAAIAIGALAYTSKDTVGRKFGELYSDVYKLYEKNKDETVAATLKFVHGLLQCCGLAGVQLTELVKKTCPKADDVTKHANPARTCQQSIESFIDQCAPLVTGVFVGTGALLITQVVCAALFSSKIHRDSEAPQ